MSEGNPSESMYDKIKRRVALGWNATTPERLAGNIKSGTKAIVDPAKKASKAAINAATIGDPVAAAANAKKLKDTVDRKSVV